MMTRSLACCTLAAVFLPAPAGAQITVQQPVVRSFSVNTTVSVPDRGAAHLGRVARAADSRSRFGPLRTGTGIGSVREHAGMHVGARIHDFDEMDRALLGGGRNDRSGPALTGYAAHSYRSLLTREARSTGAAPQPVSAHAPDPRAHASSQPDAFTRADQYYRLGVAAEERGSPGVARLHFGTAARLGSTMARERLERIETQAVVHR